MAAKTYIISTDDTSPGRVGEIAQALRAAGLHVTQQLDTIGVIVGSADEDALARIRQVPGVAAVEEERSVQTDDPA